MIKRTIRRPCPAKEETEMIPAVYNMVQMNETLKLLASTLRLPKGHHLGLLLGREKRILKSYPSQQITITRAPKARRSQRQIIR